MELSTSSISNEIDKSIKEDFSVSQAAIDEIKLRKEKGQEPESISNEEIKKGDPILDTYKVLDNAIHGGMGSVWRVHHESWNTDLAMKRPQPRFFAEGSEARKEEFIKECENWINLGLHPNIVSCYYVREIGGVPTIFSEWMDNGSLKDRIKDSSLYEGTEEEVQERILDIAIQTARGLKYSHENNLIHQDVKPGNILLTKDWDAKVADFGLAKAQSQLTENKKPVSTGYTIQYCPREQAEGAPAEKCMDVYAWALTVLEMYAGKRLWESGAEVKEHFDEYPAQCAHAIPNELQTLLKSCLTNNPDDRNFEFIAVAEVLAEIYTETCGHAYPRIITEAAKNTPDSLNNRALSFLDLGMEKEAEKCWVEALILSPDHQTCLYNQSLHLWRTGKIHYEELLRRCKSTVDDPKLPANLIAALAREEEDSKPTLILKSSMLELSPAVQLSSDGKRVYLYTLGLKCMAFPDGEVYYDLLYDEEHNWAISRSGRSTNLSLTKDGKYLLVRKSESSISSEGVWVCAAETGEPIYFLPHEQAEWYLHPDGRHCYIYCPGGVFKYLIETGAVVAQYPDELTTGRPKWIDSLHLSLDGERLYAVDSLYLEEGHIIVWNEATAEKIFECETAETKGFSFSRDSKLMYTYSKDAIAVWHTYDMSCEKYKVEESIDWISLSHDDKILYVGNEKGVTVWNTSDMCVVGWLERDDFEGLQFGKDEKLGLLFDGYDNIKVWDTHSRTCIRVLRGHRSNIVEVCASSNLSSIVSRDFNKTIYAWDLKKKIRHAPWQISKIKNYSEQFAYQKEIEKSQLGIQQKIDQEEIEEALLLLEQSEKQYEPHLFYLLRRELTAYCRRNLPFEIYEMDGHRNAVYENNVYAYSLAPYASPCGDSYAVTKRGEERLGGNAPLYIFDEFGSIRSTYSIPEGAKYGTPNNLCYSRTGRYIAVGTQRQVFVWDVKKDRLLHELTVIENPDAINSIKVQISPDEKQLLISTRARIEIWDLASGTKIKQLLEPDTGESHFVMDIRFSPDGSQIFSIESNGTIRIFHTKKLKMIKSFSAWPYYRTLHFTPDGSQLYITSDEKGIGVWDTKSWKPNWKFAPIKGEKLGDFCISPDGITAAVIGEGTVQLWTLQDRKKIWEQTGMKINAYGQHCLDFSPNSCMLYVGTMEKIHVFIIRQKLLFPGWTDWDEAADCYLQQFLATFPQPDEEQEQLFMRELKNRGYGYICASGVKSKLKLSGKHKWFSFLK